MAVIPAGPTPRGHRRCRYLFADGSRCGDRTKGGPNDSVVCLCEYHTIMLCPRGTREQQLQQYQYAILTYGWQDA